MCLHQPNKNACRSMSCQKLTFAYFQVTITNMQLYFITQIDVILQENKIKFIHKVMEIYFG
jgi:hypothetical protein